jgi:hypothetical protein
VEAFVAAVLVGVGSATVRTSSSAISGERSFPVSHSNRGQRQIDMSKRDRCGSIATLEKCFGFAPTSQHRAARYVGNLNMGPDKQETGSFRSNYPGGQMS